MAAGVGYEPDGVWRSIERLLPFDCHVSDDQDLAQEIWRWRDLLVHVDAYRNAQGVTKIVALHGMGTNARYMSMLVGKKLSQDHEFLAVDLPGYGMTAAIGDTRQRSATYRDWIDLVADFVARERDGRPILLFGFSAGGMLAYHVVAEGTDVSGIVGTTFIDQQYRAVGDATASHWLMNRLGGANVRLATRLGLGDVKLPMWSVSKMGALANDPALMKLLLRDRSAAGNWVSQRFLASYIDYRSPTRPQDFCACPILLAQPELDRWTPLALSKLHLDQLTRAEKSIVILENGGHFPVERPALEQLHQGIANFAMRLGKH